MSVDSAILMAIVILYPMGFYGRANIIQYFCNYCLAFSNS